jgi:hypothetical protein
VESTTLGLTQRQCILTEDFAASYSEGLSHTAKVEMEGSPPEQANNEKKAFCNQPKHKNKMHVLVRPQS